MIYAFSTYLSAETKIFLLILLLLTLGCNNLNKSQNREQEYSVMRVHDGDTLTVVNADKKIKVRLFGVDCPELDQPYGKSARSRTQSLTGNQSLTIKEINRDQYERTVAIVFLQDRRELGKILISEGLCYWYRKYAGSRRDFEAAEQEAKKAKLGVWSRESIKPWQYRYQNRR